ncbi:MAG: AgmX/PglI C-terminal domain-containing protein [Polyangiales bacterium]
MSKPTPTSVSSLPHNPDDAVWQLVKRYELDAAQVEDVRASVVEVTVLWSRAVLHVAHLDADGGFSLSASAPKEGSHAKLTAAGVAAGGAAILGGAAAGVMAASVVGALAAAGSLGAAMVAQQRRERASRARERFVVDGERLGVEELPVVMRSRDEVRFVFGPGAAGEVELHGVKRSIDELRAAGIASPSPSVEGATEVAMVPGGRYRLEIGDLAVVAKVVPAARRFATAPRRDRALAASGAAAMLAVATMIGAMKLAAPDGSMLTAESSDASLAALRDFIARHESRPEETPAPHEAAAAAAPTGQAASREAGAMGRPHANSDGRYQIRRRDAPPQVGPRNAREVVENSGVFVALGRPSATPNLGPSVFDGMIASGNDDTDVNGRMNGDHVGEGEGSYGLDGVGTGVGGGGHGDHTVGTGPLGTLGNGFCPPGQVCRVGASVGVRSLGPRHPHGPIVRTVAPAVEGISPEVIRRVVQRNLGQVNRCYEQGLSINPRLSGRVAVRFVIGGGGTVLGASVAQDSLGAPSVSACVAGAVRRWSFPVPATNGPITVTYPFTFMPAEG